MFTFVLNSLQGALMQSVTWGDSCRKKAVLLLLPQFFPHLKNESAEELRLHHLNANSNLNF